jgi:hypothetical protein
MDDVLLITIDGVEVRDTDKVYVIRPPFKEPLIDELIVLSNIYPYYEKNGYWFFHDRAKAQKYLIEKTKTVVTFAPSPIPVMTPLGSAYVIYITSNPIWENDEITCAMEEDGQWRHFNSSQIKSWKNETYDIGKNKKA